MKTGSSIVISSSKYVPSFRPIPSTINRPFISVMIPTYHCALFLEETLQSVLSQAESPEKMQIEVIDDHSTADNPEEIVSRIGRGRVSFFRQPENVGHTKNFATCIERAKGEIVHLLHGDDLVSAGYYKRLGDVLSRILPLGPHIADNGLSMKKGCFKWKCRSLNQWLAYYREGLII